LAVAGGEWSTSRPEDSYRQWYAFDTQGPEFVAYALFSFALGVAAGAAIGRTVPAMAVVLVGFVGARAAIELFARRNFIPPVEGDVTATLFGRQNQDWMLGIQRQVDLHGNAVSVTFDGIAVSCSNSLSGQQFATCVHEHGVMVVQAYQPADRFPLFQGIETAIFVIAAIVLLGLAAWLVGRRA
jgi:hypothetical protein